MKLLVLALVHIVGVYGGQLAYEAPYAASGVPQPHANIPGATTTYHGNGRFIGFPSGSVNQYAVQSPVVQAAPVYHAAPVIPVAKTVHTAQPVIAQTGAYFHRQVQPLVTKTILPAQPLIQTHAVLPAQPVVPVAHIHAQPALLQKQFDIPTPAFKTSKYQVRRPAIQKQFYDIEERVIIRPAGSAVVELDPPHAKIHQGTILTPIHQFGSQIHQDQQISSPASEQQNQQQNQQQQQEQQQQKQQQQQQQQGNTDDSITVEAASRNQNDISYVRSGNIQSDIQGNVPQLTENQRLYIHQLLGDMMPQQLLNNDNNQFARQQTSTESTTTEQQTTQEASTTTQNYEQTTTESAKQESSNDQNQQPLFRQSNNDINLRFDTVQEQVARNIGSNVVNQRFIDLFTARQGIAEIANQNILQKSNKNENIFVRGRIVSAELNQNNGLGKNSNDNLPQEKINTRRIVVARPIETLQEVHVVEPITKVHRVTYQQPALLKSAHLQLQPGYYH